MLSDHIRIFSGDIADENAVQTAKINWKEFFDTALHALLDYEMRRGEAAAKVEEAALVADTALAAYEARWGGVPDKEE